MLQVTYNTLIDVYGKLGRWEDALQVLQRMKAQVRPLDMPSTVHILPLLSCEDCLPQRSP
jgi:pentatricopeptide repeat protein